MGHKTNSMDLLRCHNMWYLIRGLTVRLHNVLYVLNNNEIYYQKTLKLEIDSPNCLGVEPPLA